MYLPYLWYLTLNFALCLLGEPSHPRPSNCQIIDKAKAFTIPKTYWSRRSFLFSLKFIYLDDRKNVSALSFRKSFQNIGLTKIKKQFRSLIHNTVRKKLGTYRFSSSRARIQNSACSSLQILLDNCKQKPYPPTEFWIWLQLYKKFESPWLSSRCDVIWTEYETGQLIS